MAEAARVDVVRKAIEITGIVQGVGFRPFVYRLANECNLVGFIANTSAGVSIEVQGGTENVERFLERLPKEIPPLARLTSFVPRDAEPRDDPVFRILSSRLDAPPRALISPDVAVCDDCLREMMNARDRRFRYPFINCTNCGPRFTIIATFPTTARVPRWLPSKCAVPARPNMMIRPIAGFTRSRMLAGIAGRSFSSGLP